MKRWFPILLALAFLVSYEAPAQLVRESNTSLRLPERPRRASAYRWEPAFGQAFHGLPVALATPPGETNRLFVVERTGLITLLTNITSTQATARPFLDIRERTTHVAEDGLLGLAFHPKFAENGYFYVFYTATNPADARLRFDRLSRFQLSSTNKEMADPNSEQIIINQLDFWNNHNAGDVHFGADGYLYVSLGDGGGAEYDQGGNSQHIDKDFFSGIIRIDVDKRAGNLPPNSHPSASENYLVPSDNPFVGATSFNGVPIHPAKVRTEFWAVGLRNPWRFSFDPETGTLWCGDVGERYVEEINIITKGGNYGWVYSEGTNIIGRPPSGFSFIPPVYQYSQAYNRAVIGGLVYRGQRIPQLQGAYIFTDFFAPANTTALRLNSEGKVEAEIIAQLANVTAFGVDPSNGDLLACDGEDNSIRRLTLNDGAGDDPPNLLSQTGAFDDLENLVPSAGIVPYEVNLSFWSDGAKKKRWFSIPNLTDQFVFKSTDAWQTTTGAVWIKHFEIQTNAEPNSMRRLETRLLVRNMEGVYGLTYRWNNAGDAELVPEDGLNEALVITENGTTRTQVWRYPSRTECLACHNTAAGWVLGFNSGQMNRPVTHGSVTENQITALSRAGYLQNAPEAPQTLRALVDPADTQVSQEYRVRSYLAANCSQCHRPDGPSGGIFDARINTLTDDASLIRVRVNDPRGPAVVTLERNSISKSMIYYRMAIRGDLQMPPWSSNVPDPSGLQVLQSFINGELVSRQSYVSNWVQINFPDPTAPSAQPLADPDLDGASNLLEFLSGGAPLSPGDQWKISAVINSDGAEIRFLNPANRSVIIETAEDNAVEWKPLNVRENRSDFPATATQRVITDPNTTQRARFYRAQIAPP